jgi:transcriptional regulator with GAF, ATPase, and Fis domain
MTPDALREVALQVAQSRTLQDALEAVVNGLARTAEVALVRLWLIDEADQCASCAHASVCTTRDRCLHLVAGQGLSVVDPAEIWSNIDGEFSRIPLNDFRKVGLVASQTAAVLIEDVLNDDKWGRLCKWEREEEIVSFAGQPLVSMGETLGALGVFSRSPLTERELGWLRTFADRAAVSIVNARAFDEIAELKRRLELERDYLRQEVRQAHAFGHIIGESPALQALLQTIEMVAPTETSVLLQGESGTGKELVACAIHERSPRKDRTLVRVNCAAIPRELFESEFFGHVKGSFSGAVRDRIGRFELADGGTLFLDEVGEIPLDLQSKLLRVLQEGTFERVGDEQTRAVDVRVIAATNRDLKNDVAAGRFREDLYYRLSVFPVGLPALRERKGDVPLLAQHFLDLATTRMKRDPMKLTVAQARALQGYDWPGNIRELQNAIERGVIMSSGRRIRLDGLLPSAPTSGNGAASADVAREAPSFFTETELRQKERANLVAALRHAGGKVSGNDGAAELLGIKSSTLASRMKKFAIDKREYVD